MKKRTKHIACILIFILLASLWPGELFALENGPKTHYLKIKGPKVLSFKDLNSLPVQKIDQETILHLPPSAKLLLVEKHQVDTARFGEEIRAYTVQQVFFWLLATAILVYARVNT